jgi:DNA-binding Lrp family transcriptional regulator
MADIERSDLDKLLLANAKKSLSEISELTGLSEADAATRLSQLYEDKGALYDLYRERQLIEELYDIYDDIKLKAQNSAERNSAGLYNALRQIMVVMFDKLEKARARNASDLTTVNEAHARVMFAAISLAFEKAAFELEKRYPDVDRDELESIMLEALPLAQAALDNANG